jgi:transposase InsO family protein
MNTEAATKVAQQKLKVLELAETLGNITAACRQQGISRTSFYEYKRRFEENGLEGLKDLPPIVKNHPFTTAPEHEARVVALSLLNPSRGCNFLSDQLRREGLVISYPTVQSILNRRGLDKRYDRWLELERQAYEEHLVPTAAQLQFLTRQNPLWRERQQHVESSRPGELLCQDSSSLGNWGGQRLVLHTVVDTYSSYAFCLIWPSRQPEAAAGLLYNDVLPFYAAQRLPVGTILTDNGTEFCGTPEHPYELYLALNEIEHRCTKVRSPQTNGFVERFIRTVKEEFFQKARLTKLYETMEELQTDLAAWLLYYNGDRPHQGYRNMGRTPLETIQLMQQTVKKEG